MCFFSFAILDSCSVRAGWVEGINEARGVCWTDETDQQGVLRDDDMEHPQHWLETVPNQWANPRPEPVRPSFKGEQGWQRLELTMPWLNLLNPNMHNATSGRNPLALVLEQLLKTDYPSSFSSFVESHWTVAGRLTTALVSPFVADGLSRLGWNENHAPDLNQDDIFSFHFENNVNSSKNG